MPSVKYTTQPNYPQPRHASGNDPSSLVQKLTVVEGCLYSIMPLQSQITVFSRVVMSRQLSVADDVQGWPGSVPAQRRRIFAFQINLKKSIVPSADNNTPPSAQTPNCSPPFVCVDYINTFLYHKDCTVRNMSWSARHTHPAVGTRFGSPIDPAALQLNPRLRKCHEMNE